MLSAKSGIPLQHVPYRGVAPALTDVMGGQVSVAFASFPSCIQFIKDGKLRALSVSSAKRYPALPKVQSISEVVPDFAGELWGDCLLAAVYPKVSRLAWGSWWPPPWQHRICASDSRWPGWSRCLAGQPAWSRCCAKTFPAGARLSKLRVPSLTKPV